MGCRSSTATSRRSGKRAVTSAPLDRRQRLECRLHVGRAQAEEVRMDAPIEPDPRPRGGGLRVAQAADCHRRRVEREGGRGREPVQAGARRASAPGPPARRVREMARRGAADRPARGVARATDGQRHAQGRSARVRRRAGRAACALDRQLDDALGDARRSRSRPRAHSTGNRLMGVKPGMVLISETKAAVRARAGSRRARSPRSPMAR